MRIRFSLFNRVPRLTCSDCSHVQLLLASSSRLARLSHALPQLD